MKCVPLNKVIHFTPSQGDVLHTYTKPGLTPKSFTGKRVWFKSISDLFSSTSVEKAFLLYTLFSGGAHLSDQRSWEGGVILFYSLVLLM